MSLGPWQTQRQGSQRSVVGGYKEDYSSKQYDHITLLITSLFSLLLLLHKNRLRHILKSNCVPSPVVLLCIFLSPAVTASPAHFFVFRPHKKTPWSQKKIKKKEDYSGINLNILAPAWRHQLFPPSSSSVDNTSSARRGVAHGVEKWLGTFNETKVTWHSPGIKR